MVAARLVKRYESTLALVKWPLFVTWTAWHSPLFPIEGFKPLFDAAKKIRRQKWFTDKVQGGIISGEVSWGRDNGWHYHLHSILDVRWLSVTVPAPPPFAEKQLIARRAKASLREVSEQWKMALGRDGSIKAQRCNGREAVQEVLKYAVTAASLLNSPDLIGPVIDKIQASRLVRSWGNMYGHLRDLDEKKPKEPCKHCGQRAGCVPDDLWARIHGVPRLNDGPGGRALP